MPLDQKQTQNFNEYEAQIHDLYKNCETDVHNFFDTEEDKDRPKYGNKGDKAWSETPFRKEIEQKWKELKLKMTTEFMDVTKSFGKSYDLEISNEDCHFCCQYDCAPFEWKTI